MIFVKAFEIYADPRPLADEMNKFFQSKRVSMLCPYGEETAFKVINLTMINWPYPVEQKPTIQLQKPQIQLMTAFTAILTYTDSEELHGEESVKEIQMDLTQEEVKNA